MSVFSTVGDVLSEPEFEAPGNALLWGTGGLDLWGTSGLDETCRDCTGFLIMPQRPHTWRVQAHGCYKSDNADLGCAPRDQTAHFPVFLHLRVTNLLGPDSIMCSDQAQQHRMERATGKYDRKRLRQQLAQQPASSPMTTQTQPSAAPIKTPPHPQHFVSTAQTVKHHASSTTQRPIGSMAWLSSRARTMSTSFQGHQ